MDPTIGTVAQVSLASASAAATTNQQQPLLRFVSDPIAAQTIASQTITVQLGFSASSTNSAFAWTWMLTVWRPSTGAAVGQPINGITRPLSSAAATTAEVNSSLGSAGTSTSVTAANGDVLILEIWRNATVQTMGTSYTNTIFYDGTTEASATNNAAFLQFTNDVALASVTPAIALRDTSGGSASSSSTWTITLPTGTKNGDFLVLVLASANAAAAPAAPFGWTSNYTLPSGSGQNVAIYTAPYSAGLTLTFPAYTGSIAPPWICGSYYHQDGTTLLQVGNVVGTAKSASSTTMPTGAPTTGASVGEYEVLAYGVSMPSTSGLTQASGSTIDNRITVGSLPADTAAIGHNQTISLPASTTVTAFNQTIASNSSDTIGIGILLQLAPPRVPPAVPTDSYGSLVYNHASLQNYWRLDETSGVMLDYKGITDATVTSGITRGVTTPVAGPKLGAQYPTAANTEKIIALNGDFSTSSGAAWALELWFMLPTAAVAIGANLIFGMNAGGTNGFQLTTDSANTQLVFGQGLSTIASTGWTFTRDVWHHAVARYDGTTLYLYVDGTLRSSLAQSPSQFGTQTALGIGSANTGTGIGFRGSVDEVAFYRGAIASTMAADHYAAGFVTYQNIVGASAGMAGGRASFHTFDDDFNRANSTTIGGNWVEVSGSWSIAGNAVQSLV